MESLFNPAKGIHLGGSIVAIGASAIGIVTEAFGYRLFRVTLFMIGFAFGGTGIAMLAKQVYTADEWVVTASWVAFVVGGVFAASSSCIWQHSASLLTVAGVMLVVLNDAFGYMIYPSNHGVILALLCMMFGLLGGILALKLENVTFRTSPTSRTSRRNDVNGSIPGAWCVYLAGFVMLFVLIMCIQFCSTSRDGYYHKHNASHHRTAPPRVGL